MEASRDLVSPDVTREVRRAGDPAAGRGAAPRVARASRLAVFPFFLCLFLALAPARAAAGEAFRFVPRHVVLLLFGGVSRDALLAAERIGKYPALSLVVREGLHVDACYAGLPSVPERTLTEFLTGLDPVKTVPARAYRAAGRVRGFALEDRAPFKLPDETATLFTRLPGHGLAVGSPVARGARSARFADFEALPRLVAHAGERHDRAVIADFLAFAGREIPPVSLLVLMEPGYTYAREGAAGFEEAFARMDRALAAVILFLRDRRALDETLLVVGGLPGLPASTRRVDLKGILTRAFGVRVMVADGRNLGEGYYDAASAPDLVLCPNGRANLVYAPALPAATMRAAGAPPRGKANAAPGVTLESLVATLARREETECVIHPAGFRRARVVSRRGESEVAWHLNGIRYEVLRGEDPLALAGNPAVAAGLGAAVHPAAVWLRLTAGDACAGAPALIAELFEWEDAPLVFHVMRPGFTLAGVDGPGTCGGLSRHETLAPLILLGAGLPAGRIETGRPRDLLPTLEAIVHARPAAGALDGKALRLEAPAADLRTVTKPGDPFGAVERDPNLLKWK